MKVSALDGFLGHHTHMGMWLGTHPVVSAPLPLARLWTERGVISLGSRRLYASCREFRSAQEIDTPLNVYESKIGALHMIRTPTIT